MLRKTRTQEKIYRREEAEAIKKEVSSGAGKRKQPGTIQYRRAETEAIKVEVSSGGGKKEQPRTIQKGRDRGYKSRGK